MPTRIYVPAAPSMMVWLGLLSLGGILAFVFLYNTGGDDDHDDEWWHAIK
jgi:hypothetical protein